MRSSQLLIATLKQTPADAEVVSHQLMLRAGLIRRLASGLYTWLPLGLRVLRKVETIVREEMDRSGAQEVLMPVVQPAELWQESGRWQQYGPELLRINDRHERAFCLGPTHEEVITDLARNELRSYRQLPVNFYQIQTKFRDEIRPRFGVMRAREFIMKDAYSFHLDAESLDQTYRGMHRAYCRIFDRIGLGYRPVIADTGSIGGSESHEFHVLADSGEDAIAFSDASDYAANVEKAEALAPTAPRAHPAAARAMVATPGKHTIADVATFLGVPEARMVKTLVVNGSSEAAPLVALALRGDHQLNAVKAEAHPLVASPLCLASEAAITAALGCRPGSIGPADLGIPVIAAKAHDLAIDKLMPMEGFGAHLDPKAAASRALMEVATTRGLLFQQHGAGRLVEARPLYLFEAFASDVLGDDPPAKSLSELVVGYSNDILTDIRSVCARLREHGLPQVIVVNLTRKEIQVPTARVIVPGMEVYGFDPTRVGERLYHYL